MAKGPRIRSLDLQTHRSLQFIIALTENGSINDQCVPHNCLPKPAKPGPEGGVVYQHFDDLAVSPQTVYMVQNTLPDGSLCCPTKPVLTALPPIPPNDAPLTFPEYLNARCQFNIVGNNQTVNGIVSASINCNTADGTDVLMYMGSTMLTFAANFKGRAQPPAFLLLYDEGSTIQDRLGRPSSEV